MKEEKSYDKNYNPLYKEGTKLTNKWRKQTHLESFKKYGNGWWWFVGVAQFKNKKTWIEKYRKGD